MKIEGKVEARCPACGRSAEHVLVQLVHAQHMPEVKARLLRGELNVARCPCGKVTRLACELVYQDPQRGLLCHVCPGGEAELARAEAVFSSAFSAAGTERVTYHLQRIVPSQNALLEKVKIVDAGLDDRAVEMMKVLLLASVATPDDDRELRSSERLGQGAGDGRSRCELRSVLLFIGCDEGADVVRWLLFDAAGEAPTPLSSPLSAMRRLQATVGSPAGATARRIDRAWAIEAVRAMIAAAN